MFLNNGKVPQINFGHPMAQNLDQVWLPGMGLHHNGTSSDAFEDRFCWEACRGTYASARGFRSGATVDNGKRVLSPWGDAWEANRTSDGSNYFYGILNQANEITSGVRLPLAAKNYTHLLICRGATTPIGSAPNGRTEPIDASFEEGMFRWDDTGTTSVCSYVKESTDGTEVLDFQVNKSVVKDVWYHFVGTGSTGETYIRAYLDGELSESIETFGPDMTTFTGQRFMFGSNADPWPGAIFMYAVWGRALSASDIYSMYVNPTQIFREAKIPAAKSFGRIYINDAATLDGGEVLQPYPGVTNWSDTLIDVQSIPDTTGLSGQLYVIVERADGSIDSHPVTISSSGNNTWSITLLGVG